MGPVKEPDRGGAIPLCFDRRWSATGFLTARCPECGYELEWDEDECPNCGAIIGDYEEEAFE